MHDGRSMWKPTERANLMASFERIRAAPSYRQLEQAALEGGAADELDELDDDFHGFTGLDYDLSEETNISDLAWPDEDDAPELCVELQRNPECFKCWRPCTLGSICTSCGVLVPPVDDPTTPSDAPATPWTQRTQSVANKMVDLFRVEPVHRLSTASVALLIACDLSGRMAAAVSDDQDDEDGMIMDRLSGQGLLSVDTEYRTKKLQKLLNTMRQEDRS